jgi:hypothetical protein
VRLAELAPAERRALVPLASAQTFTAVLRPRASGLSFLAADDATVELYQAVARRSPLPGAERALERLVLDRVLEVETEGGYQSGAAAMRRLWPDEPPAVGDDRIGRLSHQALLYGQTLRTADAVTLARRLYLFNRRPLSASWRRRLPSRHAVSRALGLTLGGTGRRRLERDYVVTEGDTWLRVHHRSAPISDQYRCKLYVSPSPESLPEVFATAIQVLATRPTASFKVAASAAGFLRPDKFVAYFATSVEAADVAASLQTRLAGAPPHGVPFTTSVDPDGLLSLGLDPPDTERLHPQRPISWRAWLTDRLATALVISRNTPIEVCEPWQFALYRIGLAGVDPRTWRPDNVHFDSAQMTAA